LNESHPSFLQVSLVLQFSSDSDRTDEFPYYKGKEFLPKIRKYFQSDWFMNQTAMWNENFKPTFVESSKSGYVLTFNMLPGQEMFNQK
jgi:hypothetical protein